MAVSERDKESLRKKLDDENLQRIYQSFIDYCMGGVKAGIDVHEYETFVHMTLSKDVVALSHGLLSGVFTWNEYWDKMQMLVAWDLMIRSVIDGQIQVKSNGEDTEKQENLNINE